MPNAEQVKDQQAAVRMVQVIKEQDCGNLLERLQMIGMSSGDITENQFTYLCK